MHATLTTLVSGVDLLCLDAGNTVIFLDHPRLATLVTAAGHPVLPDALVRAEGAAKLAQEQRTLLDPAWPERDAAPLARSGEAAKGRGSPSPRRGEGLG